MVLFIVAFTCFPWGRGEKKREKKKGNVTQFNFTHQTFLQGDILMRERLVVKIKRRKKKERKEEGVKGI